MTSSWYSKLATVAALIVLVNKPAMAVEEAEYVVAGKEGAIELRDYAPFTPRFMRRNEILIPIDIN